MSITDITKQIRVFADQLTHVLTAGAVPALGDLFVHEGFERIRQGDVHGAHGVILGSVGKIWQAFWVTTPLAPSCSNT